jgi:hypothetical protein
VLGLIVLLGFVVCRDGGMVYSDRRH